MGISTQTFYRWKKQYRKLGVEEFRRVKELEEENRKIKQLVAALSLAKLMRQDVLSKELQGLIVGEGCSEIWKSDTR